MGQARAHEELGRVLRIFLTARARHSAGWRVYFRRFPALGRVIAYEMMVSRAVRPRVRPVEVCRQHSGFPTAFRFRAPWRPSAGVMCDVPRRDNLVRPKSNVSRVMRVEQASEEGREGTKGLDRAPEGTCALRCHRENNRFHCGPRVSIQRGRAQNAS